ncbi:MAG: hypothetical protein GF364_22790 [Candidatus Lokiarchaeota archaeon]|nr:hypothetical protein [Candidatus Lokiarchaeota archaeon]
MTKATEKQLEYRRGLIEAKVAKLAGSFDNATFIEAFLAVNLPEPADVQDASAQIEALNVSMKSYARQNSEWFARFSESDLRAARDRVRAAKAESHEPEIMTALKV